VRFSPATPLRGQDQPGRGVRLEEDANGPDANKYTWANSAYAMAVNINRSFKTYGWCFAIRGIGIGWLGGKVLPTHTFPTDDGGST